MAIYRLPPELLQLVFSHYIGESREYIEPALRHGSPCTPFHLSLVCRQWYSLVVGNPDLWSNIHIRHPQPHDVSIFKLWLQRSADRLLTLSIHENFSAPPVSPDNSTSSSYLDSDSLAQVKQPLFDIVELATGVSERWKAVHLSVREDVGQVFLEEEFEEREFPNLESFVVNMHQAATSMAGDPSRGVPIHALCRRLCSSAKLKSVKWEMEVDEEIWTYLPFHQLTSLSLAAVTDAQASAILPHCQELMIFEVQHYRSRPRAEQQTTSPIVLPRLQMASLRLPEETNEIPTFFTKFVTPSLQELRLERGFGRSTGNGLHVIGNGGLGVGGKIGWEKLIKFLEGSECKLKKLVFCPEGELSFLEKSVMKEHLKNRVFSELRRSSLR